MARGKAAEGASEACYDGGREEGNPAMRKKGGLDSKKSLKNATAATYQA